MRRDGPGVAAWLLPRGSAGENAANLPTGKFRGWSAPPRAGRAKAAAFRGVRDDDVPVDGGSSRPPQGADPGPAGPAGLPPVHGVRGLPSTVMAAIRCPWRGPPSTLSYFCSPCGRAATQCSGCGIRPSPPPAGQTQRGLTLSLKLEPARRRPGGWLAALVRLEAGWTPALLQQAPAPSRWRLSQRHSE